MKKEYIVYKATNKLNGKIYIGITSRSLKERIAQHLNESKKENCTTYNTPFKRAIRKYGINNFEFIIVESNLTFNEASEKEKYYIKTFNTYCNYSNSNGYNATLGGELIISSPKDRVVQLDRFSGIKINTYSSAYEAQKCICRGICECIHHNKSTAGGYCWLYEKEYLTMTSEELFDYVNCICKRIIQFDLKGNIIKIYDKVKDIANELNLSIGNISQVMSKKRCSTGGFVFMYYDEYKRNGFQMKNNHQDRSKKIYQLNDNKEIINEFESATKAAEIIGTKVANISSAIKRNTRCANFYWQYK